MSVKMMKYNIVLFSAEREGFIERLRELGMVDITTSGWEPTEGDRELISAIDSRTKALDALEKFAASDDYVAGAKAVEAGKAFEAYQSAQTTIAATNAENGRLQKVLEEWLLQLIWNGRKMPMWESASPFHRWKTARGLRF